MKQCTITLTNEGERKNMRTRNTTGLITVDTVQLNTPQEPAQIIKGLHARQSRNGNTGDFELILNPNKYADTDQLFYRDTCINSLEYMIDEMDISQFKISRVDLAYDTYAAGDYGLYCKLNRLLLSLIANKYKCDNAYASNDFWSDDVISMKIKSRQFDIENYDKSLQEPDGKTTNRFEIRVKNIYIPDVLQAIAYAENKALTILDKAVTKDNYNAVVDRFTYNILLKISEAEDKEEVNDILVSKSQILINTNQITQIFEAVDYYNPAKKAERFINKKHIEKISFNMVKNYAEDIKKAIKNYRENIPNMSFFDQQITA